MAILSFSKQFIFIHIPKCGGSSIEAEWKRLMPGDLVIGSQNSDDVARRYAVSMHATLQMFRDSPRIGNIDTFETCAVVRHPLKVIESFYKYGLRQLRNAVQSGMTNLPQKGWSADEWTTFVRDKLASGDTSAAPSFVARISDGAVREAMLSTSFDEYLERVGDKRWERYQRGYVSYKDQDVAVKTVLRLEDAIAIRKYFKVRYFSGFNLLHTNKSGSSEHVEWSKPMRRKLNEITEAEHKAFGYEVVD